VAVDVAVTRVTFAAMTDAEVAWYVATPEPYDKAGGYAVQGLASRFVAAIAGSYANVVGLPVELVCRLMTAAGEDVLTGRRGPGQEAP
jgi:septum formation protein